MVQPIAISAPGKLFLIGEYAVLDGAPALLTAVDRRVYVTLDPAAGDRWRVSAPNLGITDLALGSDGSLTDEIDDKMRRDLAVFDAVRMSVVAELSDRLPPLAVCIDSSDFARDGHKLGLGSSAAVAAALTCAFAEAGRLSLTRAQLATLAIRAHRRAQDGAGSGGDVATCVYGGVIRYVQDELPQALDWPPTLALLAVVTGEGARTPDLVARVKAYAARDATGYAADIGRLARLADTAQHDLARTPRFLQLAEEYFQALSALDHHAGAGIVSRHHEQLHALATRYNAVFKTSGAGGGDVGLAFVRRGTDEESLARALTEAGAHVVPLVFAAPGVRVESARNGDYSDSFETPNDRMR